MTGLMRTEAYVPLKSVRTAMPMVFCHAHAHAHGFMGSKGGDAHAPAHAFSLCGDGRDRTEAGERGR